ncbi:MAG: nuclear transport factor 2 family protein [Rhodothermia bacterium]|nr:nuclear transport factor 2 family protein [Rhodothermia bacterium]
MRDPIIPKLPSSSVIAFAAVAIILGGCGNGPASDEAKEVSSMGADSLVGLIEDRVADYYDAMSNRDWPAYREFFWPGATLTTAWQPPDETSSRVIPTTIEAFIEQTDLGPDSAPVFEERLLEQEATIRGPIAVVFATYEARFGDDDSVITWRGTDAFTWLNHQDEWRIASLVYATDE